MAGGVLEVSGQRWCGNLRGCGLEFWLPRDGDAFPYQGVARRGRLSVRHRSCRRCWVAVKELKLSYHNG